MSDTPAPAAVITTTAADPSTTKTTSAHPPPIRPKPMRIKPIRPATPGPLSDENMGGKLSMLLDADSKRAAEQASDDAKDETRETSETKMDTREEEAVPSIDEGKEEKKETETEMEKDKEMASRADSPMDSSGLDSSDDEDLPDLEPSETREEREERISQKIREDLMKAAELGSLEELRSWEEKHRLQEKAHSVLRAMGVDLESMWDRAYLGATHPDPNAFPSHGEYLKAHFPDIYANCVRVAKEEVSYLNTGDFEAYKKAMDGQALEGVASLLCPIRRDAMAIRARLIRKICQDHGVEINEAEERRKQRLDWGRAWCSMPYSYGTAISLAQVERGDHQVIRLDGEACGCGHVHDARVFNIIMPQLLGAFETEWQYVKKPFGEGFFAYCAALFEYLLHDLDLAVSHAQGKMCHNRSVLECVKNVFNFWRRQRVDSHEGVLLGKKPELEVLPLAIGASKGLERKWRERYFIVNEMADKHRNIAELALDMEERKLRFKQERIDHLDEQNRAKNRLAAERGKKETGVGRVAPMYFGASILGSPMMRLEANMVTMEEQRNLQNDKKAASE